MNRSYLALWAALFCFLLPGGTGGAQSSDTGKAVCTVLENGESASGTVSIQKEGKEVVTGNCGDSLPVVAGRYTAVVSLDGALDGPQKSLPITVKAGEVARFTAGFDTGILEVRIESKGRRAAGMAIIRRDGKQIGTLGSGVSAHLSAGTYQVEARYRIESKLFEEVVIEAGQQKVLEAAFD